MVDFGKISVLKTVCWRQNPFLRSVSLRFSAFFALFLFSLTVPVFAEDMSPPSFAGAMQSGAAFWEFSENSDQPTSFYYLPPLVEPKFGFRYYSGAWEWQSGAGIAGDGAMLLFDEESLVQPIPDGDGDFITIYVQLTWQGAEPDLGIGLEIWADPYGWTPGEEFEEEHLDGEEWPDPIEEYDLGGGWTQSTFAATFWSWEVAYVHIILHMDIWYDLLIDEAVVDMVIHDDYSPPVGPGRPGGAGAVEILGEWEDESSDLSRAKEAGSGRALIFTAHTEDDTGTDMNLTSVTYGGQAMTKVIDRNIVDSGYRAYVGAFILDEPGIAAASGGSFEVSWAQAPSRTPAYSSVFFSGVDQEDLVGASDSAVGIWINTIATGPLATNDGDMVIVAATAGNTRDYQVGNDFTEAVELAPGGADGVAGYKSATGADETPQVTLIDANRQAIIGFVLQATGPDTTPPVPDPMTWAVEPYATGRTSIAMTATTASDPSGVRYYFDETSGNSGGNGSGWQVSEIYVNEGLSPDTLYIYRVKAQDFSVNRNETAWSVALSATTYPPDTEPPIPDPALWAAEPIADSPFSISMMAVEATDESGVEYYFQETSGNPGGADSGWQNSTSYTDTGLDPENQYCYQVVTRDKSTNHNETAPSGIECATTLTAIDISIMNPSFESGTTGWSNATVGSYEYYAPPEGTDYATRSAGAGYTTQLIGHTIAAGETFTLTVWARNIYSDSHTEALKGNPTNYPLGNPDTATAEVRFYYGSNTITAATVDVNPVELQGAPQTYPNDDGGNVWLDAGYRMQFADNVFYQLQSADPLYDSWTYINDTDYDHDMAVGPIITPQGLKACYNTYYEDEPPFYSEIWILNAFGSPPDYSWSPESVALYHYGDEDPWVIDAHLYYDEDTSRLWMSWGGHVCYISELNPTTGLLINNPLSLEYDTHPPGTHTAIMSFAGEIAAHPSVPPGWDGDIWSQGYMEGPAIYKHNSYYYAFGSYGNLGANYTIRMGRSSAPTGPYYDKDGYECTTFYPGINRYGCSMLLGDDADQLVPGHPHIWEENSKYYLGYDYRTEKDGPEFDVLGIRRLYWVNHWPTIWTPITVTFNASDYPAAIGQELGISLRNVGQSSTYVGFDYVSLVHTPGSPETEPPIPNPTLWASGPMALGLFSIGMIVTEATDESGVQYYFEEISGNEGGSDSGWQQGRSYTDYNLIPQTQYTYRAKARDMSPQQNETDWSVSRGATTDETPVLGCPAGDLDNDCDCDIDDLRIFAGQWLDEPGCINHTMDCADLNEQNDGVDSQDFAVLAANWLQEGANLVINEMMADNETTITDEHGEYDDWIEIFNPSGVIIDLGGMYLADNDGNMWMIPLGTSIVPGEYKLFWADKEIHQGNNHTNFGLGRDGDGVTLYDTDGTTPIDSKSFSEMHDDISYGRWPDAVDNWYDMSEPTPGSPNIMGMAGGVYFSRPGGTFTTSFSLGLATPSPTATIYYTLNGDEPSDAFGTTSLGYTGPITISETTWVRARAYEQDLSPSLITSKTYIKLATDVQSFQSNLPIVIIDSFGWDIDDLDRDFYPVSAVFIDTDEFTGTCAITDPADWTGCGGMHIRGNSTTGYDKKQYRFETWDENSTDPEPKARYRDLDVSLLGMPAESDWIIHGPYSDKTLMRNYQMFTWSRQIGRYAVRTRFVEVFLDYDGDGQVEWDGGGQWSDTDYRGVYIFMEKIKRGNDRVDIARLDPSDNAEPEISGGYILKKDWGGDGFMTEIYEDYMMYEDPRFEELTWQQRQWIQAYINVFETVLSGPAWDDPFYGYVRYIDVGSFIDHHILVEFAKNVDGFLLSTFLYKERNGKINMGPIWDYNGSLGGADYICNWVPQGWLYEAHDEFCCTDWCCEIDSCWRYRIDEGGCEDDILPNHYGWYERLFEDPEFLLEYADNWFKHREYDFKTENMLADVDNNVDLLTTDVSGSNAIDRNFDRWYILEWDLWPNYYDNCNAFGATYMSYVNWMRGWISDRLAWMESAIDADYGDAPPVIKVNSVNANRGAYILSSDYISMTGDGTIYYTLDGSDPRAHGGGVAGTQYTIPFTRTESTQVKARIRYATDNWSALNEATFAIGPVAENLRITEIMYHPPDPNHEYIELTNIGDSAIELNLVKFTDGINFTFPSMGLPAGCSCVVARNQTAFMERYPHQDFIATLAGEYTGALNNAGERIELQDALGQTILNFRFKDGWYPITDGADFSLNIIDPTNPDPNSWEYAEYWQPSSVAGGTPGGDDTGHVASPGDIVINEVMAHSNVSPDDWIELHNTTGSTINISGWFLSDNDNNFKKYEIPSTSILAGGYVVFTEQDHFGTGSGDQFAFSELGDTAYLCSGSGGELAGGFCAKEDFKASEDGVSFGRYTKSAAAGYDVDFVSMSSATYEAENTTGAKVGPVVITEIMYHPASNNYAEYVELKNISGTTVALDDWRLIDETGGIEYYIPSGTSLTAGAYLLLTKNEVALNEDFTPTGTILEWFEGRLSNGGEKIELQKPGTPEPSGFVPYIRVDRVNYSDGSHGENFRELGYNDPWPTTPDGTGQALHRVVDGNYGNDVANWQAATPTPGEGAAGPGPMNVDLNMDELWMYQNVGSSTNANLTASVSIVDDPAGNGSYSYSWEFVLPGDVTVGPSTISGGGTGDAYWNFASPNCNEPAGLSDSGQALTVKVTVTGDDYANTGSAEAQFGIALLADVNNDTAVTVVDRSIINAFWRMGSAGSFTFKDCNVNSDDSVNGTDRSIANAVLLGLLGQNTVASPCPFR